jgi:hypothetical protein
MGDRARSRPQNRLEQALLWIAAAALAVFAAATSLPSPEELIGRSTKPAVDHGSSAQELIRPPAHEPRELMKLRSE